MITRDVFLLATVAMLLSCAAAPAAEDQDRQYQPTEITPIPTAAPVALVDGEATLKRFFPEPGGRVRLQGANPAMSPIVMPASRVVIQGILVGLLRKY